MGINTNGPKGAGGNGSGTHESTSKTGALLDMLIEPLAPNVDVRAEAGSEVEALLDPNASPPADRNASVIQLFPAGSPPATPSETKPYVLEVTGGNGTTSAAFATFEEAARAFVYRSQSIASLKYLSEGQLTTLAWVEAAKAGAEAQERYANDLVRQSIMALQRKKAAYNAPASVPPATAAAAASLASSSAPVPAPAGVVDQYQRILNAYNCRNGIYRGMFNIKVLEDLGNEILFHRTSEEATQACVALALTKGWSAVEIGGTPERKERAWLAYTLAGIKVTNYSPPMHVLERYQALSAGRTASSNVDRPAAEAGPDDVTETETPPVRMRAGG